MRGEECSTEPRRPENASSLRPTFVVDHVFQQWVAGSCSSVHACQPPILDRKRGEGENHAQFLSSRFLPARRIGAKTVPPERPFKEVQP